MIIYTTLLSLECGLPFGVIHCYNILLKASIFTQMTHVASMHTEEYDLK